jgi:hypothetical protein
VSVAAKGVIGSIAGLKTQLLHGALNPQFVLETSCLWLEIQATFTPTLFVALTLPCI